MSNTILIEFRIGRNINGVPMYHGEWAEFIRAARTPLENLATELQARAIGKELKQWVEVHTGTGTWTNEETGETESEDSAVVTLYTNATAAELDGWQDTLYIDAGELAWDFDQDAVALVWQGVSTLVPNRMHEAIEEEAEMLEVLGTVVGSFLKLDI
jgi:hypothetical protein